MSRLSLRARLVLAVLALATVGLLVADAATYASLRSFLVDRVDSGLAHDDRGAQLALQAPRFGPAPGGGGGPSICGGGTAQDFVELLPASGAPLVCPINHFQHTAAPPPPRLPSTIALPSSPTPGLGRARFLTVPATTGGGSYRVLASAPQGAGPTLILATSLDGVDGTLHRLLLIELFVTLGVLAAIGALALWIIRLGLRPLTAIERTADRISEGDLSPRVERAEPRTEVGKLGLAFNTMLDRLEGADARLRRFVGDASHELRTPLAAVRAYAELFERGADRRPDDLARAMDGIRRESERMSALVEQLLLLARLDEDQALAHERVPLDELAREAVETARTVDPGRRIELSAEPRFVLGDPTRLRQVLDNLLANVRAHTPPGTPATVALRGEGTSAVLEVADAGPGVEASELPHLFERFYRPDSHRSRDRGGAGLGLAIVAAIADAHGGSAAVNSAPGEGMQVRFTLPLAAAEAPPA